MDGKVCLMTDLARHVSPFLSLLPPHKMIFLYTTSLLREGEETANKFLAQTKMAAITPGKHTLGSQRPNPQAFLSIQDKGAIHLICALFILKEHTKFSHLFILFLLSTHKTFEKPAVNGQIVMHKLEAKITANKPKGPIKDISLFEEYHIASL